MGKTTYNVNTLASLKANTTQEEKAEAKKAHKKKVEVKKKNA